MFTIQNDTGRVFDTKIVDDNGVDWCQKLPVESVSVDVGYPSGVRAQVVVGMPRVNVRTDMTEWVMENPKTGSLEPVALIVFASGQSLTFCDGIILANHAPTAGSQ